MGSQRLGIRGCSNWRKTCRKNVKTRNLWMWAFWHLDPHANAAFDVRHFQVATFRPDAYPKHVKIPLVIAARIEVFLKRANITLISGQKVGTFQIHVFDKKWTWSLLKIYNFFLQCELGGPILSHESPWQRAQKRVKFERWRFWDSSPRITAF